MSAGLSKYNCDSCNFHTNIKTHWLTHINREFHKTGKRKTRSDKLCTNKCFQCDYITKSNTNLKQHILNLHGTKEERKQQFKYYCDYCDYGTFAKPFYEKHIKTPKHLTFVKHINSVN